eukprot:Sspe_Gene.88141::Locus_60232_Transcript_1_1_Confidence_1.000_Length_2174::g.88141::m.88141/K01113/phoD; alkaline phosphatase D
MLGVVVMLALLGETVAYRLDPNTFEFEHGVASGDMTDHWIVLWTRVTPQVPVSRGRVAVEYSICEADENGKPPQDFFPPRGAYGRCWGRGGPGCRCRRGVRTTGQYRDFTVKVDAGRLRSNKHYFYQFRLKGTEKVSDVGATRTLPSRFTRVEEMRYAVFSCSNYPYGYFHAYELAATVEKLDFWLHVGDYIYEFGSYRKPGPDLYARQDAYGPLRETVTLDEYRERYSVYRRDPALQKLHRRAPMYAIWDDHEVTDNSDKNGAENHQTVCTTPSSPPFDNLTLSAVCDQDEGDYQKRVDVATRAYYEWLPIRERGASNPANRRQHFFEFHFGDLASFAGYDARYSVRTLSDPTSLADMRPDIPLVAFAAMNPNVTAWGEEPLKTMLKEAAERTAGDLDLTAEMFGAAARSSMREHFMESKRGGAPWQVLATPLPVSPRIFPNLLETAKVLPGVLKQHGADDATAAAIAGGFAAINQQALGDIGFRAVLAGALTGVPISSSVWDGYPVEREKVLEILREATNNAVVVAGDSHNAYAAELSLNSTGEAVAVEYDAPSVTSPGLETTMETYAHFLKAPGYDAGELGMVNRNPSMKYANLKDRGFVIFDVTRERHVGEYVMINTDRNSATNSNADVLLSPEYSGVHYCDARATVTAGTRKFSDLQAPHFFVPVPCQTRFNPSYFDDLFTPSHP